MKKILIIVPLYKSYHLLDNFISKIFLEQEQDFEIMFIDNTDDISESERNLTIRKIFEKYNFDEKLNCMAKLNNDEFQRMWYSQSVNWLIDLYYDVYSNVFDDRFIIFNPDHYPLEENWLTKMIGTWDEIKNVDNKISTLGTLQYYTEESTSAIWHYGCFFKKEEHKCHPLDWYHNFNYDGSKYIKCEGNTGSGIMIDYGIFKELNMFDMDKYPHYSGDADFCLRASEKGYTHYCSSFKTIHTPNKSSK